METSRTATVIDKESTAQSIPESKHNTHEGHVPRRRLKFMEMLGHPDRINTSETQKHKKDITVWNHHKAVLFEFWLENLFMCVPAVERVYPNAITLGIASFIVGHALSPSLPNTSRLIGTSKVSKIKQSPNVASIGSAQSTWSKYQHIANISISFLILVAVQIPFSWPGSNAAITGGTSAPFPEALRLDPAAYDSIWSLTLSFVDSLVIHLLTLVRKQGCVDSVLMLIIFSYISSWPESATSFSSALLLTALDSSKKTTKALKSLPCLLNARSLIFFGIVYAVPVAVAAPVSGPTTLPLLNGLRSLFLVTLTAGLLAFNGGMRLTAKLFGTLLMPIMALLCVALILAVKHADESVPWLLYAVGVGWVLVSMIALQVEIRRFEEDQRLFTAWVVFFAAGLMCISSIIRPDEIAVAIPASFTLALFIVSRLLPRPRGPLLPSLTNH